MGRYKNKWFRLSLEKDLKNQDLGVNVHCKEDGMHITIPPAYEPLSEEMMRVKEDLDTEKIVSRLKEFTKDYGVTVELELKVKNV